MTPMQLLRRLGALLRGGKVDRDMDSEMSFHLEMEAADLQRSGLTPDEARARRRGWQCPHATCRASVHRILREAPMVPLIVPLTLETPTRRRYETGTSTWRSDLRAALICISTVQP